MITNSDISAESLGLVPKGQKKIYPSRKTFKNRFRFRWSMGTKYTFLA